MYRSAIYLARSLSRSFINSTRFDPLQRQYHSTFLRLFHIYSKSVWSCFKISFQMFFELSNRVSRSIFNPFNHLQCKHNTDIQVYVVEYILNFRNCISGREREREEKCKGGARCKELNEERSANKTVIDPSRERSIVITEENTVNIKKMKRYKRQRVQRYFLLSFFRAFPR